MMFRNIFRKTCVVALSFLFFVLMFNINAQNVINVSSDYIDVLLDKLDIAQPGDTLNLIDVGPFFLTASFDNSIPITVKGDASLAEKPRIEAQASGIPLFLPTADLTLMNLEFPGRNEVTGDTTQRGIFIGLGAGGMNLKVDDCVAHHLKEEFIRGQGTIAMGDIRINNVLVYDIPDVPIGLRDGITISTLEVKNSTFNKCGDKMRLRPAAVDTFIFDAVTIANFSNGYGIELRDGTFDVVSLKNMLIVNCFDGSIKIKNSPNLTIDYSNFYQDSTLGIDPDPFHGDNGEAAFNAGIGNIMEDPVFQSDSVLSVSINTQTAFGSEFGTQMGDPRWGTWIPTNVDDISDLNLPTQFKLHQNYPNPFNPSTSISYELAKSTQVSLVVYNLLGQKIAELANVYQKAGVYQVNWSAKSIFGQKLAAGVYYYKLNAGNYVSVKKMILLP